MGKAIVPGKRWWVGKVVVTIPRIKTLRLEIEADGHKFMHPRRKIIQDRSLFEFEK
jgi:hypothetical protein